MNFFNFWKSDQKRNRQSLVKKRLNFEQLENKRLLAIVWANEFGTGQNDSDFNVVYGPNAAIAREIVNRAIDDWNAVIPDQNFDNDNNPATNDFQLDIFADDLGGAGRGQSVITDITDGGGGQAGWNVGVPFSATITLDDNGGGIGWFFDTTPLDDAEFTAIANPFHVDFINATTLVKLFFLAA